jgi:hypothetical protein
VNWAFGIVALGGMFLVVVCCAALVEVFSQLDEIRHALNLQDLPTPLGLKRGELRTTEVGLPHELEKEPEALVVFLSPKCTTCLAVAEAFRGSSPSSVWFVLSSPPTPRNLLSALSASAKHVIVDHNDQIADRIHLHVTPSVLTASFGEITRALAIATPRQVLSLVPSVASFEAAGAPSRPEASQALSVEAVQPIVNNGR